MIDKPLLYCLAKLMAVMAVAGISYSNNVDITFLVISTLSFVCFFLMEFLLGRFVKNNRFLFGTILITIVVCFLLDSNSYLPVITVTILHLLELGIDSKLFYYVLAVSILLSIFLISPGINQLMLSGILLGLTMFCRIVLQKYQAYHEMYIDQKEIISDLNKKLNDLRGLTKTIKHTISLEERNRIAARIHDQIGHGISGSIILLEASLLVMKDQPDKAAASVQKAINNLREGVDEIRAALREERADRYLIRVNDVTTMLEEFRVNYNKSAILRTTGDLDYITPAIWGCIHDNLKECLTNVLKHSNATEFILNIEVFKKIIKVEYKDNGRSTDSYHKGMGLEAIEERTAAAKGRCFIHKGEHGFCITNIFSY